MNYFPIFMLAGSFSKYKHWAEAQCYTDQELVSYCLHTSLEAWMFQLYGFVFMGEKQHANVMYGSHFYLLFFYTTVNGYKIESAKVKGKISEVQSTKTQMSHWI